MKLIVFKVQKGFLVSNTMLRGLKTFKLHFVCMHGGEAFGVQVPRMCVCGGRRTTMKVLG